MMIQMLIILRETGQTVKELTSLTHNIWLLQLSVSVVQLINLWTTIPHVLELNPNTILFSHLIDSRQHLFFFVGMAFELILLIDLQRQIRLNLRRSKPIEHLSPWCIRTRILIHLRLQTNPEYLMIFLTQLVTTNVFIALLII